MRMVITTALTLVVQGPFCSNFQSYFQLHLQVQHPILKSNEGPTRSGNALEYSQGESTHLFIMGFLSRNETAILPPCKHQTYSLLKALNHVKQRCPKGMAQRLSSCCSNLSYREYVSRPDLRTKHINPCTILLFISSSVMGSFCAT